MWEGEDMTDTPYFQQPWEHEAAALGNVLGPAFYALPATQHMLKVAASRVSGLSVEEVERQAEAEMKKQQERQERAKKARKRIEAAFGEVLGSVTVRGKK
jgi:hypothetical protein